MELQSQTHLLAILSPEDASCGNKTVLYVTSVVPKFYITGQEMSSKVVVSGREGDFPPPDSVMRQSASFPVP